MNEVTRLHQRNCILREADHRYIWDPEGVAEEMAISVTGVISFGKPPVDYSRFPEAAPRGTHVHRAMEAIANGDPLPDHISPEGINCLDWYEQIGSMTFWEQCQTIACEYTMTHKRKSLGGQLDLICEYTSPKTGEIKILLIDLKTKSANWKGPSKEDLLSYRQQFGGYLYLISDGDDARGGCWVDECRTLIVTPNQTKWLPPMDLEDCYLQWEDCWERYSASAALNPF